MTENDLTFVPKAHNPPSAPQIRPIEAFWGIFKQRVYSGNWSAKDRNQLIRQFKKCVQEKSILKSLQICLKILSLKFTKPMNLVLVVSYNI